MRIERIVLAAAAAAAMLLAREVNASEVTRTLTVKLTGADLENFAVENLAGTMRIRPGSQDEVEVVATVHAANQELADGMRLERLAGPAGAAVVRVRFPSGVRTIRYRPPREKDEYSLSLGLSSTTYDYDGHSYRVSTGHGKRVWADLEVKVPPRLAEARFRNLTGLVEADDLEGRRLSFHVASADLRLRELSGEISLEGSSGDIRASRIRGDWSSRFSSGDCEIENFDGGRLSFRTSSGDVRASGLRADRLDIQTSSGDADLRDADLDEFRGQSSSGDLTLEASGVRLRQVRANTSSGNVTVRLPREASFDAEAEQSSGDLQVGFSDGTPTRRHEKLVAYRRGTGATRIRLETSSGDVEILPR